MLKSKDAKRIAARLDRTKGFVLDMDTGLLKEIVAES